jgi:hypothetical protein
MVFQPTPFNLTTLLLGALTVWIIITRYRSRVEANNWPLFYLVALFAYSEKFDAVLNSTFVYVAIVAGLLLRFEFLSGWPLKLVMYAESAAMVYVIMRCLQVVFGRG